MFAKGWYTLAEEPSHVAKQQQNSPATKASFRWAKPLLTKNKKKHRGKSPSAKPLCFFSVSFMKELLLPSGSRETRCSATWFQDRSFKPIKPIYCDLTTGFETVPATETPTSTTMTGTPSGSTLRQFFILRAEYFSARNRYNPYSDMAFKKSAASRASETHFRLQLVPTGHLLCLRTTYHRWKSQPSASQTQAVPVWLEPSTLDHLPV